jgi:peptidoglycan/xylan/chitin deacetylase (PgdA/CDA1 family)
VCAIVERILAPFGHDGGQVIFLTLGRPADQNPGTIKYIAAAGQEIASHGYEHWRALRSRLHQCTDLSRVACRLGRQLNDFRRAPKRTAFAAQ